jgi:hypothetical protein
MERMYYTGTPKVLEGDDREKLGEGQQRRK